VGAGSASEGVASLGSGAAPLGADVAPLCAEVVPLVAELSALAVERAENETKATAPSAMAETRRALYLMATSLQMGRRYAPHEAPSPAITLENAQADWRFP
jgi:hypothetical protein